MTKPSNPYLPPTRPLAKKEPYRDPAPPPSPVRTAPASPVLDLTTFARELLRVTPASSSSFFATWREGLQLERNIDRAKRWGKLLDETSATLTKAANLQLTHERVSLLLERVVERAARELARAEEVDDAHHAAHLAQLRRMKKKADQDDD